MIEAFDFAACAQPSVFAAPILSREFAVPSIAKEILHRAPF
jgi:hypothetical protein